MKLYKLKPLSNFERVLDIILNERLYCAYFEDLNDPFEGLFLAVSHLPPVMLQSKGTKRQYLKSVSDLHEHDNYSRICSLSTSFKDVRLWSHYADGHKGVAIEIDFSGYENDVLPIEYLNELRKHSNTILGTPFPDEVLRQKTVHWQYENEIRIIQASTYYPVVGRITRIFLGARASEDHKNLLAQVLPKSMVMIETKINENTQEVVRDKTFQ